MFLAIKIMMMEHKQQQKARIPVSSGRGYQGKQDSLLKTRALPIRQSAPIPGCRACAPARARGFAVFWLLAAVVFVATFAGVITLQYQATQTTDLAAAPAVMETPIPTADTPRTDPADKQPVGQAGKPDEGVGAKTMLAALKGATHEPLPSGTGQAQSGTGERSTHSNEDIHIQLGSLEPPAAGASEAQVDRWLAGEPDENGNDIVLHEISGQVLNQAGKPMANVELMATARRISETSNEKRLAEVTSSLGITRYTKSANDGKFVFSKLLSGEYDIQAKASAGYKTARISVRSGTDSINLVLLEKRLLNVSGRVTDAAGRTLSGVKIVAHTPGPVQTRTDEEGLYVLELGVAGLVRDIPLQFSHEGYRKAQLRLDVVQAEDEFAGQDVSLQPVSTGVTVAGTLRDSDGMPVSGERIRLYSPGYKHSYTSTSTHGGDFMLEAVEIADDYLLAIRPNGPYQNYTLDRLKVDSDQYRSIELQPVTQANLNGKMVDINGAPVPGLTLMMRGVETGPRSLPVTGDQAGRFVVESAPMDGVLLETSSYPRFRVTGIKPSQVSSNDIPVTVDWGEHAISGRVLDTNGKPLAASRITLTWSHRSGGIQSASTRGTYADVQGKFSFTNLGPGKHLINVNHPGFEKVSIAHDAGAQEQVLVQLQGQSG